MTRTGRVLHVGCGGVILPHWFEGMQEVRLDIDPDMKPDIVASMTDMGEIGEYEALFCSHALEHLYPHEVQKALAEFKRVLKPEAHAIIFVPDLEDVRPTEEILLVSPAGPITGLDMIFGHRVQLEGRPYMAHHCGFTSAIMRAELDKAGFSRSSTTRLPNYNLMGVGIK
jgi:SAM-dependent methyltransferase